MLVLTGNPGVGKHTTASEIMKQNAMYEIIDINNLAIELGLTEKAKETLEVYVAELKIKMKQKKRGRSILRWIFARTASKFQAPKVRNLLKI